MERYAYVDTRSRAGRGQRVTFSRGDVIMPNTNARAGLEREISYPGNRQNGATDRPMFPARKR
jgi:hypothetical protein